MLKSPVKIRPLVTRFCGEIISEVLLPKRQTGRVVILVPGVPSSPFKPDLLKFLVAEGYSVLLPRYRGSWESTGEFLRLSPHEDILDIIHELTAKQTFISLIDGEKKKMRVKKIILIGASFGGAAVLLASRHPRVSKVIALSPVTDWTVSGPDEPFEWFQNFTETAFGGAYRAKRESWQKLRTGNFYNPRSEAKTLNGKKIFILHPEDDGVVPVEASKRFVEAIGGVILTPRAGAHLGIRDVRLLRYWKPIQRFLEL